MARIALELAGAVAGFLIAGPGGAAIGAAVGAAVGPLDEALCFPHKNRGSDDVSTKASESDAVSR